MFSEGILCAEFTTVPYNKRLSSYIRASLCTPTENNQHSYATNAERKSSAPKLSKPVLGRRRGSEGEWVEYASGEAAAQALGLKSGSAVSACCRGKAKRTGEYEFMYAPLAEDQHDRPGEEWRAVQL